MSTPAPFPVSAKAVGDFATCRIDANQLPTLSKVGKTSPGDGLLVQLPYYTETDPVVTVITKDLDAARVLAGTTNKVLELQVKYSDNTSKYWTFNAGLVEVDNAQGRNASPREVTLKIHPIPDSSDVFYTVS